MKRLLNAVLPICLLFLTTLPTAIGQDEKETECDCEKLREDIEKLKDDKHVYSQLNDTKDTEIEKLKANIQDLKDKLSELEVKEERIKDLETINDKLKQKLEKTNRNRKVKELEEEKEKLALENDQLKTEITRLQRVESDFATANSKITKLDSTINSNKETIEDRNTKIKNLESKLTELKDSNEEINKEITNIRSERDNLKKDKTRLETERDSLQDKLKGANSTIAEKEEKIQDLSTSLITLEDDRNTFKNRVAPLQTKNEALNDMLKETWRVLVLTKGYEVSALNTLKESLERNKGHIDDATSMEKIFDKYLRFCQTIKQAREVLSNPYNQKNIDNAQTEIDNTIKGLGSKQKVELKQYKYLLRNYCAVTRDVKRLLTKAANQKNFKMRETILQGGLEEVPPAYEHMVQKIKDARNEVRSQRFSEIVKGLVTCDD